MKETRLRPPQFGDHREHVLALFAAALAAVDPGEAVRRHLRLERDSVHAGDGVYPLHEEGRLLVIGAGKAGIAMGQAALDVLGDRVSGGVLSVPRVPELGTGAIRWIEGGHPLPTPGSVKAGSEIRSLLADAKVSDLVLVLISGGGSALLELPAGELSLRDLQAPAALPD
jgi:hydroxypyruvate reductase